MSKQKLKKPQKVAYFSMEFAFDHRIPNYAGGLGVLAADYMLSMADKKVPAIGVSLIYHQNENPRYAFKPESFMQRLDTTVQVPIEDRLVTVGVYQYEVPSQTGKSIPVYFLTTNFPNNEPWDRDITKNLYPDNAYYRITQEAILGIGGVKILRALGYKNIDYFHMNEGHAAFLTLELLREENYDNEKVRKKCRFTTHTPVAAGHDYFDYDLAYHVLGDALPWHIRELATNERLSMTHLALNLSEKTNSVAEKHQKVCQDMFRGYEIQNVTNGVHSVRWASSDTAELFDKYIPKWRLEPEAFSQAVKKIPETALKKMKRVNKQNLVNWVNENRPYFCYDSPLEKEDFFDTETLTIGFARRCVPYKRPLLIFKDLDKFRKLGYKKIQFVFAGPIPADNHYGQNVLHKLREIAQKLRGQVRVVVIPDYSVEVSRHLVAGVDVWLNTPIMPREASGTSGMKVALNGGLNLSIPDGWWVEGIRTEPLSGWAFGGFEHYDNDLHRDVLDAQDLYEKLEFVIDEYYHKKSKWTQRMLHAIALMEHFSSDRSIEEYAERIWS